VNGKVDTPIAKTHEADSLEAYLMPDGRLVHTLEMSQFSVGGATIWRSYIKIESDGKWLAGGSWEGRESYQEMQKQNGTLNQEELAMLGKALAKYSLLSLKTASVPEKKVLDPSGKGLSFGDFASGVLITAATPEELASCERFAAISKTVRDLTVDKGAN